MLDAVAHSASQKLGVNVRISSAALFEAPEHHFFHGACMIKGYPLSLPVLYFSSVQTGIFAMTGTGTTDMFRFVLAKTSDMDNPH